MVVTARYLHLKAQELHDALISAHITIGNNLEEKIRLRDQLAAMSTKHHQAKAAATFNEERARTAEWDANQLRGQLGLAQQDLIRARNAHTTALGQAHAQAADLDDRLKASNQQAASLVESAARLQHRIRESLHQRRWTEAQIHSLMSPTNSSSSSAVPGGNASSSSSSRMAPLSPGDGNTSALYAGSYDNGAGGSPVTNRGSPVKAFTPSNWFARLRGQRVGYGGTPRGYRTQRSLVHPPQC